MVRSFVTSAEVTKLVGDRPIITPPSMRRRTYDSRLVVLEDNTTTPIIWLIAEAKFGPWNPATHKPYWIDRNPGNESFENVGLVETGITSPVSRKSQFDVPAGTPEYRKLWREKNKDILNKKQREKYAEQNLVRRALLVAGGGSRTLQNTPADVESLASKLSAIFEADAAAAVDRGLQHSEEASSARVPVNETKSIVD